MTLSLTVNETLKWFSLVPILYRSHSGGDSVYIVYNYILPSYPAFTPSLISFLVSVDVKHHVYCYCSPHPLVSTVL